MGRPRASDHDDKRRAILHQAALLFAANGYDRTSLNSLAAACGMSKALLYHYYTDKLQLLFDIIHSHLENLLAVTDLPPAADPVETLFQLADALLEAYRSATALHHIQINQLHLLPPAQQTLLKNMERRLIDRFAAAVAACVPATAQDPALLKPLTMSLFGMLNWNYLWFREGGPMSRTAYARLTVTLVIQGAGGFAQQTAVSPKRRSA